jgi:hypothetical protein
MAITEEQRRINLRRVMEEDLAADRARKLSDDIFKHGKVINQETGNGFAAYRGDCVSVMRGIPDNSLHFTVSSWPFCSLYSYTDAIEDMSNIRTRQDFFRGIDFMLSELHRATMPGRLIATHCMNIPLMLERDGVIGIYDFRGDIIRAFEKHGFMFHSEVVIWKNPLVDATRTHAHGLAHKQIVKDAAMCRMGLPDYLVVVRKFGSNPEPVTHKPSGFTRWIGPPNREPRQEQRADPRVNKYSHEVWQNYASPVWFDIDPSDTLQYKSAREDDDSRHVCPLQLTVIRRAVELWSNPNDVVFDPFGGIGSTPYVALEEGRRGIMCELKGSYYDQAVRNLQHIEANAGRQLSLITDDPEKVSA